MIDDLRRAVARMLCIGFDGLAVPASADALIADGVSAAVLFGRNVGSPGQVAELCVDLKNRARRPFLLCIDQEGGRVARLRGAAYTPIPSMRQVGQTGDAELAFELGGVLARECRALNIDLILAPVLDVDSNPRNPVIADRSFSADPSAAAALGAALIRGMQSAGVGACGKHFPGHGDTWQDSHHILPTLAAHDRRRLDQIELAPFRAAIAAEVGALMTAHVVFQPIDSTVPATLSPAISTQLLRNELGFPGTLISDDLEMKAITAGYGMEDAAVRAVNAGVDLLLVCHSPDLQRRAIDALAAAVESGKILPERIIEANRRLDQLFDRFCRPPTLDRLSIVGSAAHREVVRRIVEKSAAALPARDPTEPIP